MGDKKLLLLGGGCTLCGEVSVGDGTHVGAGSVVRQQIRIGRDSLIGAGSAVVRDIACIGGGYVVSTKGGKCIELVWRRENFGSNTWVDKRIPFTWCNRPEKIFL